MSAESTLVEDRLAERGEDLAGPEADPDRVVLVGETNPYGDDEAYALYCWPVGSSGHRLRRILGVDEDRYLAFRRRNLCAGPWSIAGARSAAARLYVEVGELALRGGPTPTVLLLGARVAAAFSCFTLHGLGRSRGLGTLRAWGLGSDLPGMATWIALPHPSGTCRSWGRGMWRVGGTVERTRALLVRAAPHVPWGQSDPLVVGGGSSS